jgi:hypothetical protein
MALTFASLTSATEVDVCVHVLEDITSPVNEYSCGNASALPPDPLCILNFTCCIPQVCKVTPACGLARVVIETIAKAGDVHCFSGISAEELWQRWKDRQIAFLIDYFTGGIAEVLLPLVKADIAVLALMGDHLPEHQQGLLKEIIGPVYDYGNTGFGYEDISNIKIINFNRNENTKIWRSTRNGEPAEGLTLGRIIILKEENYNELMNPANKYTLRELLLGAGSDAYVNALVTIIHELVHVKQHRVLGTDAFILNYLMKTAPVISGGYGHDPYEREAYNFEADILLRHGDVLCERTAPMEDQANVMFDLGRAPVACSRPINWMILLLSRSH